MAGHKQRIAFHANQIETHGTVTNTMRARMEAAIETLLALLDEMDANPDLEERTDDEPYLSTGTVAWGVQPQSEVNAEGDPSEADCPGFIAGGQGA